MASRRKTPEETKASIPALKATTNLTLTEITECCKVSTASVQRIITAKDKVPGKNRYLCGRKRKLTPDHEALVLGSIAELREREGSFTSRRLMDRTGIRHVGDRTVRRLLNRKGYFFLQARKKGLMSETDKAKRVEFARKMQENYTPTVRTDNLAFYLDGVSFVYGEMNPMDQARAPKGRVWKKKI